jgi:hypothetical protein
LTALAGIPCPACNGQGLTEVRPYGVWSPHDHSEPCWTCDRTGMIVVPRNLTRYGWQRRREQAHHAKVSACLLGNTQWAVADRAQAAIFLAERSAPADPEEAERNARWQALSDRLADHQAVRAFERELVAQRRARAA